MAETFVKARIALLMATRDQADGLHHALSTLLSQSHSNFNLTIVDDGSQDHTPEVLARFSDPRIQVITTRPQGQIPALNLAMQKSRPAAFYGVVYASVFYSFHYLLALLNQLQKLPKASGVFCCYCEGFGKQVEVLFQEPHYDANELLVRNFLGPGVLFRGEHFRLAGGLFLSEKKGLVETWQRMAAQGPFEKFPKTLLRITPSAYDFPPMPPAEFEKDVFPQLKLRIQLLPGDTVDAVLINLLQAAGHELAAIEQFRDRPQLLLCQTPSLLPEALRQASEWFTPLVLIVNEPEQAQSLLSQPTLRFLLGNCTIATRTLKIAQLFKAHGHQAIVYLHGMTKRETNRLLSRIPLVLYRHRSVVLIRAFGKPTGLVRTLEAVMRLNRPPEFGDLLIYCVDRHPELIKWLQAHRYTWFAATRSDYFPELLGLMRQLRASHVLSLDAGVIPAADYYLRLWPLLKDPHVGMVAGLLNHGPGSQAFPLPTRSPEEMMIRWPTFKPSRALDYVDRLSDSAFLMRKSAFEWMLETHPQLMALGDETLFSRQLIKASFRCLLSRETVAFNLLETL